MVWPDSLEKQRIPVGKNKIILADTGLLMEGLTPDTAVQISLNRRAATGIPMLRDSGLRVTDGK